MQLCVCVEFVVGGGRLSSSYPQWNLNSSIISHFFILSCLHCSEENDVKLNRIFWGNSNTFAHKVSYHQLSPVFRPVLLTQADHCTLASLCGKGNQLGLTLDLLLTPQSPQPPPHPQVKPCCMRDAFCVEALFLLQWSKLPGQTHC